MEDDNRARTCRDPFEVDEQTTNQRDGAYDTGHQNRQDQQSGDQATSMKEDKALVTIMEDM